MRALKGKLLLVAVMKQGRIYTLAPDWKTANEFMNSYGLHIGYYIRNLCPTCLTDMNQDTISHFCDPDPQEKFLQLRYTSEVDAVR